MSDRAEALGRTGCQYVSVNGCLHSRESATISACDRGLTEGLGAYETIKILDARPALLAEHYARLCNSLEALGIAWGTPKRDLGQMICELARRCGVTEAGCRVLVTAGASDGSPLTLISLYLQRTASRPLRVITFKGTRSVASVKAVDRMTVLLAKRWAAERGADDALLVDERGRMSEATTANVFVCRGQEILTPPLSRGVLAGVVRGVLMSQGIKAGLVVRECDLVADDLGASDVVILSSSVRGLVQCATVNDRPLSPSTSMLRTLRDLLARAEARSVEEVGFGA